MGKPTIDMKGMKFNRWFIESEATKPEYATQSGKFWNCVCECGSKKIVYGVTLRNGSSKSCGCLKNEKASIAMKNIRLKQSGTIQERFFSRFVELDNGCWQWRAHTDKDGYGVLPGDKKNIRAHRFSYELHIGEVPNNLLVCHKCDNPGCVNPCHLFLGTQKDNAQDALKKGRHYIGEKNARSKLTKENAQEIFESNLNTQELANKFGVTRSTINSIKRKRTWQQSH